MRVLITGGTGFIGTALATRLLERGDELVLVSRKPANVAPGIRHIAASVIDQEQMRRASEGCDWVFHLAAREDLVLRADPHGDQMFEVNVRGTKAVLDAARAAGVKRTVVVTSFVTFGFAGDGVLNDGSMPVNLSRLDSPYVWSRAQQEQVCLEAAALGQEVVMCAPSGVVGPGDQKGSVAIVDAFMRGRIPAVPKGGFNWICIDDVVNGLVTAAERGQPGRRYLFVHENLTHRELLERVAGMTGKSPPRVVIPESVLRSARVFVDLFGAVAKVAPGIPGWDRVLSQRWYANSRLTVAELGLPQTPIDEALAGILAAR